MLDLQRDLRILTAMAAEMRTYLLEDELLWPISGRVRGGMPRLTIGGFLLRQYRLTALRSDLSPAQQDRLDKALAKWQAARAEWSVHYGQKMGREWEMRVNLLDQFLADCENDDLKNCLDHWPTQAKHRTILYHLQQAAAAHATLTDEQTKALARVDRGLRRYLLSGEGGAFLWDAALEPLYPRETAWWLWVTPYDDRDE